MDLQTLLNQIQTTFDDLETGHQAEIEALKTEHADRLSAIESVISLSLLDTIISQAKSEGVDINTFMTEVVIQGLKEKTLSYIPVSFKVYESLMALARGRGIDLQTLTERDSFLEYIQRGVQMGAF